MTESIKLYAKDTSDHVWCKQLHRGDTPHNIYQPDYSVHKDNTIFSYNIDNDWFLDGFYLVKAKNSSLSGVEENDIFMVAKFSYEDFEGHMHEKVYYPCDFGLNEWSGNGTQWVNTFKVIKQINLWGIATLFGKAGYVMGDTGTNINLIINTYFNESWCFQLVTTWTYYGPGEDVQFSRITAINLVYGIPGSGANLTFDASSLINIHCVNGINKLYQINLDKTLRDINNLESLNEDLSTTVDELNGVVDQVDEMSPKVDSLEDRVSALESETISKYVSR